MSNSRSQAKVQVRQVGNQTCVMDIGGELTAFAEVVLMAAYNEGCGAGVRTIILNFSQLDYMSSSGIGLLVTLLIRTQRQQQRLLACGLNDHYQQIFKLTRLNEAIAIYATEAGALSEAGVAVGPELG
jgi:anti-sigma B factor antagonist